MSEPSSRRSLLIVAALGAVAVAIALCPPPDGADSRMMLAAALAFLTVGLWATAAIPEYVAALILFSAAMITAVAPASVVFSAFHSSAIWLVFGGLVLGVAADRTGVGKWIARRVVAKIGYSYRGVLFGIAIGGMLLVFLIPSSMGRILLFYPIVRGIADELDFEVGSRGYCGLMGAMIVGGYLFSTTILPANVPSVILLGMTETLYDRSISYGEFLAAQMPVFGIVKVFIGVLLVERLFPARLAPTQVLSTERIILSRDGKIMLGILCATLLLWMTDSVHGISPGWVSLGAATLVLLPGLNFVPTESFQKRVGFGAIIYIAGTIAVGVIVAATGFDGWLGSAIHDVLELEREQDFRNYLVLAGLSVVMSFGLTMAGVMPVIAPLAADLAASTGLPLITVLMIVAAVSGAPLLPFQSGPIVLALHLSGMSVRDMARLLLPLSLITLLFLLPLNWFWWQVLGLFD